MGNKGADIPALLQLRQDLSDLVDKAREVTSEARGVQKDLIRDTKEARQAASEIVGPRIDAAVEKGLTEMRDQLEEVMRQAEKRIQDEFAQFSDKLFGRASGEPAEGSEEKQLIEIYMQRGETAG